MMAEEDSKRKNAKIMEEAPAVDNRPTETTEPDSSKSRDLQITIYLSQLSATEQAICQCLQSQGWTDAHCELYFNEIDGMQDALHHRFTEEGWPESLLEVFHDRCQIELPHNLAPPRKEDGTLAGVESLEMSFKLLEEMKRRKEIGDRLYETWNLSH